MSDYRYLHEFLSQLTIIENSIIEFEGKIDNNYDSVKEVELSAFKLLQEVNKIGKIESHVRLELNLNSTLYSELTSKFLEVIIPILENIVSRFPDNSELVDLGTTENTIVAAKKSLSSLLRANEKLFEVCEMTTELAGLRSELEESETIKKLSFHVYRKTIFLLLHRYGFFEKLWQDIGHTDKVGEVTSLAHLLTGGSSSDEYKYVGLKSGEGPSQVDSYNLYTEDVLKQVERIGRELDLPNLQNWAQDEIDKIQEEKSRPEK